MNDIQRILLTARWRDKVALAFVLYHSVGVAIFTVAPNHKLWALESPLIAACLWLGVVAPGLLDIIINLPKNTRVGAFFFFSTLIWATMGFVLGFAGELVLKLTKAKVKA